jgi:phage baseplate assembly protein W
MADLFDYNDVALNSLGTDLALTTENTGGDLAATGGNDLALVEGLENIRLALIRRLTTEKGTLSRFVQDVDGIILIHEDYGNGAYKYLSEPLSNALISLIRDEIITCLSYETRIEVNEVSPRIVTTQVGYNVYYDISYVIVGSTAMQILSLLQVSGNFEVS